MSENSARTSELMTDDELIAFLCIGDEPDKAAFIAGLSPEDRAMYEKMRAVEMWDKGMGPRPDGVIACWEKHKVFGHGC
jgi:hypothetical protein